MGSGSRWKRGWRLAGDSWRVLKTDRSLLAFPIVGFVAAAIAFLLVALPGAGIAAAADSFWPAVPFLVVALYLATFVTIYVGVALAASAGAVMDGSEVTLRSGLAAARPHRGAIAKWALVQTTVGLILNLLQGAADSENGLVRLVGTIFVALLNVAWSIATFFVVPLLAFEGVGPKAALKRSAALIKERWGEGVVGTASIGGIAMVLGVLPGIAIGVAGVALGGPGGVALIAVAVLIVLAACVLANALTQVFRVALYRFAVQAPAAPGFDQADLAAAFAPKRRR